MAAQLNQSKKLFQSEQHNFFKEDILECQYALHALLSSNSSQLTQIATDLLDLTVKELYVFEKTLRETSGQRLFPSLCMREEVFTKFYSCSCSLVFCLKKSHESDMSKFGGPSKSQKERNEKQEKKGSNNNK